MSDADKLVEAIVEEARKAFRLEELAADYVQGPDGSRRRHPSMFKPKGKAGRRAFKAMMRRSRDAHAKGNR